MLDNLFCAICKAFQSHQVVEDGEDLIATCQGCGHAVKFPNDPESLDSHIDAHNAGNSPQEGVVPAAPAVTEEVADEAE